MIFTRYERYEIKSLTVDRAVNKLARAGVEVFDVRKTGKTTISLSVRAKDSQKFFAIFRGSCYTIHRQKNFGLEKLTAWAALRVGAIVGAGVFCLLAFLSGFLVYKVDVEGSGKHYQEEVRAILSQEGLSPFSAFSKQRAESARERILDLPAVSFCSVQKRGGVIVVGVEVNAETPAKVLAKSLVSPYAGKVVELICIRGTPAVKEGDFVGAGDVLVRGLVIYGEGEHRTEREAAAVARATLECESASSYISEEESDAALERAYAAATLPLVGCEITERRAEVHTAETGYVYEIVLRYTAIVAVNMD